MGFGDGYVIDCSDCVGNETEACDDCVVKFLVEGDEERLVRVDGEELRALRVLADAGLVPEPRRLRAVS